jgi:hypothetical protein
MAKKPTVHINLRIPPELHRLLVQSAGRRRPRAWSLNFEITSRLVDTFGRGRPQDQPDDPFAEFEGRLAAVEKALSKK